MMSSDSHKCTTGDMFFGITNVSKNMMPPQSSDRIIDAYLIHFIPLMHYTDDNLMKNHTRISKIASTSAAAQKAADKANAQTIRDSSLGLLTPQDKTKLKEGTSNSSGSSAAGTASSARKRNSSMMVVDMMENASERLTYRRESHVAKEARKREKQVSMALEREREFNFKVEEAKKASELQKMQLEINVEMLRFLRSQKEKEGKDNSKEE